MDKQKKKRNHKPEFIAVESRVIELLKTGNSKTHIYYLLLPEGCITFSYRQFLRYAEKRCSHAIDDNIKKASSKSIESESRQPESIIYDNHREEHPFGKLVKKHLPGEYNPQQLLEENSIKGNKK